MPTTEEIVFHTPPEFTKFLLEADLLLDTQGYPVAYRRLMIKQMCEDSDSALKGHPLRKLLVDGVRALKAAPVELGYSAIQHWYYDIYGETAYRPPFLAILARTESNHFCEIKVGDSLEELLVPKTFSREETLNAAVAELTVQKYRYSGLMKLREFPFSSWTSQISGEYDNSIATLFSSRPCYHLAMWHTHQTLEKTLKSVLFHYRWTREEMALKISHSLKSAEKALNEIGVFFGPKASAALRRIDKKCGPNVRYADDYLPSKREVLREQAYAAHQDLLTVCEYGLDALAEALKASPQYGEKDLEWGTAQELMRKKIFWEFMDWANNTDEASYLFGNEGLSIPPLS